MGESLFVEGTVSRDSLPGRRGADRTGAMARARGTAFAGSGAETAYDEARDRGMNRWHRNLRKLLYEFGAQRSEDASLVPSRIASGAN